MIHFYKRCVSRPTWLVALLWVRSGWVWVFVSHKPSLFRTKESPLKHKKTKTTNILCPFVLNAHRCISSLYNSVFVNAALSWKSLSQNILPANKQMYQNFYRFSINVRKWLNDTLENYCQNVERKKMRLFVRIPNRTDTLRDKISLN